MALQNKKYIELRQQRDFGQVISVSFDFLFSNFGSFFKTIFAITGFTFVLAMTLLSLWMYKLFNNLINNASVFASSESRMFYSLVRGINLGYLIGGCIVLLVCLLFTYLTIYSYIKIYVRNGKLNDISIKEVWNEVKLKFVKYLVGGLIYFIFYVVINFIVISSLRINGFLYFLTYVGFTALFYYSYLYFTVIVNEDEVNIIDAFGRSFYLIRGRWWFTFGISIVIILLCYVLTLLLTFTGALAVGAVSNLFDSTLSKYITYIILISLGVIGTIYLYMIFCFFIIKNAIIYYNFVEMKDNVGLLEKIHSLGGVENTEETTIKTERNKQQYTNEEIDEDF